MKNFVQEGKTLNLTAPTGGVVSGVGYILGALFCVAVDSASEGGLFPAHTQEVVKLPKNVADSFTIGQQVFWDDSAKECRAASATGRYPIGVVAEQGAVAAGTDPIAVRLDGVATVAAS